MGSGGREHAIAWKLRQSSQITELFVAPGNAGIARETGVRCVDIVATNIEKIITFVKQEKIEFVIVGPEKPLSEGLVDRLQAEKILVLGPTKKAAQLESSKIFAKRIMEKAGIPTARFSDFVDTNEALQFVRAQPWQGGFVVKADGLCAGKGVVVCDNSNEAGAVITDFLQNGQMGEAGKKIVVEEKLIGKEVSAFALCDGEHFIHLGFACDYKQLEDGGKGPNTGGMGAYTPVDWLPSNFASEIGSLVVQPLLQTMRKEGNPFCGILFTGLMLTAAGPKVLEFNTRFGDPETQALLPMIDEDILPWFLTAAHGTLAKQKSLLRFKDGAAVHIVMAAAGYPGWKNTTIRSGDTIFIDDTLLSNTKIFFAGVKVAAKDLQTSGGRVLGVTAWEENRQKARELAYKTAKKVSFKDAHMRTDIGL